MECAKCIVCGTETLQGVVCAVCQAGITQMHRELMDLVVKDRKTTLRKESRMVSRYHNISMN